MQQLATQQLMTDNASSAQGAAAQNLPHNLRFQGPHAGQLAQSIISQRQVSPGFLTSWASPMPISLPGASDPTQAPFAGLSTPPRIVGPPPPHVPQNGLSSTRTAFPSLKGAADPASDRQLQENK